MALLPQNWGLGGGIFRICLRSTPADVERILSGRSPSFTDLGEANELLVTAKGTL